MMPQQESLDKANFPRTLPPPLTLHIHTHQGEVLASVPKRCCIYSDPDCGDAKDMRLLPATAALMRVVAPAQWRLRLALALLSERVRPGSAYRAFLRNLPFEYWGLPMFFDTSDFSEIQDSALMQRQRDRCRFLLQFATDVLRPMQRTAQVLILAKPPFTDLLRSSMPN